MKTAVSSESGSWKHEQRVNEEARTRYRHIERDKQVQNGIPLGERYDTKWPANKEYLRAVDGSRRYVDPGEIQWAGKAGPGQGATEVKKDLVPFGDASPAVDEVTEWHRQCAERQDEDAQEDGN